MAMGLVLAAAIQPIGPVTSVRADRTDTAAVVSGQEIVIGPGLVEIAEPMVFSDLDGVTVKGIGNAIVRYVGPPTTKGVITFERVSRGRIFDLDIETAVDGVDYGVLLTNKPGVSPEGRVSTAAIVRNVRVMHNGHPFAPKRAFGVDSFATGGAEGNNDLHTFENTTALNYREAGYWVNGTQCHQLTFTRCSAVNARSHMPGPWPDGWKFNLGAYFTARDCSANRNQCDFRFAANESLVLISNFNSEHSRQFLVTSRTGSLFSFDIQGVRWDGEPDPGVPTIDLFGPGPWHIRCGYFAGINGVCPTAKADHYRYANGMRVPGDIRFESLNFRQHGGARPVSPPLSCPPSVTWKIQTWAVTHEYINSDGSRDIRPLDFNAVP